jgi:hypothetical protein
MRQQIAPIGRRVRVAKAKKSSVETMFASSLLKRVVLASGARRAVHVASVPMRSTKTTIVRLFDCIDDG